jgi:hypothetical protein
VLAIASIQLFEDVELRLGEPRLQFLLRLRDRFENEAVLRWSGEQDSARGGQSGES